MATAVNHLSSRDRSRCGETITQSGDLLELNAHRIICGDSTNEDVVSRLFGSDKPLLMVTEPPYERNYSLAWKRESAFWEFPNNEFLKTALLLFPGDICYIWHSSLESSKVEKALRDAGFECKSQLIWAKTTCEYSPGDFHWQHEPCWYAIRFGRPYVWKGSDTESSLWMIPRNGKGEDIRTEHSGQKPIECMARPIRRHTSPGDYVYEPFCGSGSTLIACEQLGRKCLAAELSPEYCDMIVKRWIHFVGKDAIVVRNGRITDDYTERD